MMSLHPEHVSTGMCSYLLSALYLACIAALLKKLHTSLTHLFLVPWPGLTVPLPTPAPAPFQCLCCGVVFSLHVFLVPI